MVLDNGCRMAIERYSAWAEDVMEENVAVNQTFVAIIV